jgi:hypothetical protein
MAKLKMVAHGVRLRACVAKLGWYIGGFGKIDGSLIL